MRVIVCESSGVKSLVLRGWIANEDTSEGGWTLAVVEVMQQPIFSRVEPTVRRDPSGDFGVLSRDCDRDDRTLQGSGECTCN